MKQFSLNAIKFYQSFYSWRPRRCVFYPSCSEYALQAIRRGGVWYGIKKGILRIFRCHPFQANFYDPL